MCVFLVVFLVVNCEFPIKDVFVSASVYFVLASVTLCACETEGTSNSDFVNSSTEIKK